MADEEKVYYPEAISDQPLPNQVGEAVFADSTSSQAVRSPTTINNQPLPVKKVAHELLSQSLNTRSRKILAEFNFVQQGAIQIGEFAQGVSGDIRISPGGIVARDLAGNVTFAIDGDTGDAIFKGKIQAGTVISEGEIVGGQINGAAININDRFIIDVNGNIVIKNGDPTTLMDVLYDDLVIEMINIDLGKPGTGAGQLRAYTNGTLYAYLNADEGVVVLSKPVTIGGTSTPSAPLTHQASIYVDQSGGKDRLMVRFNTGASQQLAIQP